MSNIFTQSTSPEFTKQSVNEFFVQPMFMGEDIRGAITVRTDIKGTEKLNRISRPSMITKPKTSPGFTPTGTFALTYTDLTVKPMAIEFEQNGRAFWGSIVQQLLASGYKEDDVEQMKSPDIWNKIILPVIADAGQQDIIRQMYFANPTQETLSSNVPTGIIDPNYSGYSGLLSLFCNDLFSGTIPSAQHVNIVSGTTAVKQEKYLTFTYGATTTDIRITVNGVEYIELYTTSAAVTITNWFTHWGATIMARSGINGVVVQNTSAGVIKISSKYGGQAFTAAGIATGGGSFGESGLISPVKTGSLGTDEADTTMEAMLDVMPPELMEFDPVFMITNSMWRSLVKTFKNFATPMGNDVLLHGVKVPSYEGIPILVRPEWDKWIKASFNDILPHRALLTTQKNLIFGTDATTDSEMMETWYNQEAQMRRYRVQYKAQTAYLHKELVVLAGFKN
jgi:hypothetical protein